MKQKANHENAFYSGALWLTLSAIILKVIGLIYKIPISYMLGDEGMGYFNSAYTIYTFFYIVGTGGIPKAISIIVSKYEAENNKSTDAIFKTAFAFFTVAGFFLLLIFLLSAPKLAALIGNKRSLHAMYAVAPSVLFVCSSGVLRGYLSGKLRFAPIAISELIAGASKLVFGLLLANIGISTARPLHEICAYTILGITLGSFLGLFYLIISYFYGKKEKEHTLINTRGVIKSILKIAIPITLGSAASGLVNILDLSLIMNALSSADYFETVSTALYGNYTTLAVPMFTLVGTLITPVSTAMMPLLAKNIITHDTKSYSNNFNTALRLTSFICIPAGLFFLFFSRELLTVIFESGSVVLGYAFLSALAPSVLLLGYLTVVNTALEAEERVSIPVISLLAGAFVKIIFSLLLMKYSDLALFVAPIGTAISYFVSLIISTIALRKCSNLGFSFFKASFSTVLFSVAAVLITLAFKHLFLDEQYSRLFSILVILIFVLVYLILSLFFSKNTRKILLNFVKLNKNE